MNGATARRVDTLVVGGGPVGMRISIQYTSFPRFCLHCIEQKDGTQSTRRNQERERLISESILTLDQLLNFPRRSYNRLSTRQVQHYSQHNRSPP